mgnify:CR=1 FL=1
MRLSGSVYSKILDMDTGLTIVTPNKLREGKYKVVYLLHGLCGNDRSWLDYSMLPAYAAKGDTVYVMPDAGRSFYSNMKYGFDYQRYVTEELPVICRNMFNISAAREDTGIMGCSFCANTTDIFGIIKHREAMSLHDIHQFDKLHAETQIRLVASVIFHSVLPCHAQERLFYLDSSNCLEEMFCHSFKCFNHILLLNKTHLAINLGKLRLAVCTQILITETLHDLEIAVKTRNHQKLFQCLRRLGQRIELSWIHSGRNDKVTSSFRSRVDQYWCFHFQKSLLVQIVANFKCHFVTQFQVFTNY